MTVTTQELLRLVKLVDKTKKQVQDFRRIAAYNPTGFSEINAAMRLLTKAGDSLAIAFDKRYKEEQPEFQHKHGRL